jgi:2-polyprenyl-3-methyl-5-hydroxy-6-metoxy-1,4-benzoquinol methylase
MNVFSRIYQHNEWNGVETRSGPGSHREPTRRVADAIVQLVEQYGITSVLDVGCGEGSWMPDLPGYVGIDVAPEAIEAAKRNHPERKYWLMDWALDGTEMPTYFDLVIVRDVVQHLSVDDALRMFASVLMMKPKYLLASTYVGGQNVDIETGNAYSPDLTAKPFNMTQPELLIHDGYEYHDGDRLRDPAKMLGLWRL